MKQAIALVVVAVLVAGCATQGDQARTEGTLVGAGVGAAMGAGLGYLMGRDAASAGIGAAIGAIAGGAGGYVYADRIATRHKELAGKENNLDARIAFAQGINADTQQYNERLRKEVTELEPRISDVAAKKATQEITQQELEKQKQVLGTRIREANQQLALGENELEGLKKFRAEQAKSSKALDDEIKRLEDNLAQTRLATNALASLNQRI